MGRRDLIVLDTHVWLWWVSDPNKLSRRARDAVDAADELGIPSICCWEVATRVGLGKLDLDRDLRTWIRQALAQERVTQLDLTAALALDAALLAQDGIHGDPADRIIAATAIALHALLVTKDRALRAFAPLTTVW